MFYEIIEIVRKLQQDPVCDIINGNGIGLGKSVIIIIPVETDSYVREIRPGEK